MAWVAISTAARNIVLIWSAWASREHYERWFAGPSCADLLREVGPLVAEDPVFRLYHVVESVQ